MMKVEHNGNSSTPKGQLVFQKWTDDTGIFFEDGTYSRLLQIDKAIKSSKTWGEFRAALPQGEFESLGLWWSNGGESIYRDGEKFLFIDERDLDDFWDCCGEAYIVDRDAPFDIEQLPGATEGDYPPWLYTTAQEENLLPVKFVEEYGEWVNSMINGSWYVFPLGRYNDMKADLEGAGFAVTMISSYFWEATSR